MISTNYNRRSDFVTRWASPKRLGVIDDPLVKRARRRSDDVGHGGGHERRASDRRTPRGEQHVHDRPRPAIRRLAPELFRRQLLEPDPASDDGPDDAHLLGLTQRVRTRKDVVSSGVPVLT